MSSIRTVLIQFSILLSLWMYFYTITAESLQSENPELSSTSSPASPPTVPCATAPVSAAVPCAPASVSAAVPCAPAPVSTAVPCPPLQEGEYMVEAISRKRKVRHSCTSKTICSCTCVKIFPLFLARQIHRIPGEMAWVQ